MKRDSAERFKTGALRVSTESETSQRTETPMRLEARQFYLAGTCICISLVAQAFQALCILFWFPEAQTAAADYAVRLGWLDRTRALAVLFGILASAAAFGVIALDRFAKAPLASLLGFTFITFYILIELFHRGLDFAMVSQQWAGSFAAATDPGERDVLMLRHELWGSFTRALYFPLLIAGLIARTCFAVATWNAGPGWLRLASIAFAITALRTFGRLLGSYTGVEWLEFLDGFALYLALVFLTNGMLAVWLFKRAAIERHAA